MKQTCQHSHLQRIESELEIRYFCPDCQKDITRWQRKLWNFIWIKRRIYCNRGEIYIADINGLYSMIGGGAFGILLYRGIGEGNWSKIWLLPTIWFGQKALVYFLGFMDWNYWKTGQKENIFTAFLSPVTVETLRILNELRDKIAPEKKVPSILEKFKGQIINN